MSKKYKLTKTTKQVNGKTLYQIQALTSFSDVKKGDLGGWIEKEENLSHEGNCWVYNNACVYDSAFVADNARIYNNARVYDDAQVFGNARIGGNAQVFDYARVCGNSLVIGNARVSGTSWATDNAYICGNAWVSGNTVVFGDAMISKRIKLVSGKFFHTKEKSNKIEIVNTYSDIIGDDYETLSYEPRIEEIKEVGEKVKVRLAEGTIVEGEIVE